MSVPDMKADRSFLCGCAALIGFALAYALPIYGRLPNPIYDPLAHKWHLAIPGSLGPVPMGYLGQVFWGLGGAAVSAAVVAVATMRQKRPLSERTQALASAWALTAVALVLAYFTWGNWP